MSEFEISNTDQDIPIHSVRTTIMIMTMDSHTPGMDYTETSTILDQIKKLLTGTGPVTEVQTISRSV